MSRLSNVAFAFLLMVASLQAYSQLPGDAQDLTFQVPPSQTWVDTGLDLHPGDALKFSASASAVVAASTGLPACEPAGLSGTGENAKGQPLPSAPAGALLARLHGDSSAPILLGPTKELKIEDASHLLL